MIYESAFLPKSLLSYERSFNRQKFSVALIHPPPPLLVLLILTIGIRAGLPLKRIKTQERWHTPEIKRTILLHVHPYLMGRTTPIGRPE